MSQSIFAWTTTYVLTYDLIMASVHKRIESKYWIAAFTDSAGRRLKKSTKETNKRLAEKIAAEYETAAIQCRTVLQIRKVFGDLTKDLFGHEMTEPTVREHFGNWLKTKTGVIASATLAFYKNATGKVLAWLGERADQDLRHITRTDLLQYRNDRAKTAAPKTVNHEIKVLRMVFKSARKDGILFEDPSEFVETVRNRTSKGARRPFTIPQLHAVLDACNEEWRSLVLFGLYSGQRLGDLATLRWSHLDLQRAEIRITTAKTGRFMQIPIAEPLMCFIETLNAPHDPDAPVHPKASALMARNQKAGGLSNQFTAILALAGLRNKKAHRKTGTGRGGNRDESGLSFHSLRHTTVSMMKDAGIPAAAVMEMVGHNSVQMSQHYTHTGREALERAAAALPDLVKVERRIPLLLTP
jgi:integrase